jgi:hypothetical protein
MRAWNSGAIRLASGASAADKRRELTGRYGATVAEAIMNRGDLADNVGVLSGEQAHHLIPVELLQKQGMLRVLVNAGWDFNQATNGIPLAEGFHGNHPQYNRYVGTQIDAWVTQHGTAKPNDFHAWVDATLLPHLRGKIAQAKAHNQQTGQSLNDYFATQ